MAGRWRCRGRPATLARVKVDILFRSAGMDELVPDQPDADKIREALVVEAETFFHAGGVLTLSDWAQLGGTSRSAFVAARAAMEGLPASSGASGRRSGPTRVVESLLDEMAEVVAKELAA